MKEFSHKYQLTAHEEATEKPAEKSSKKNDYQDRYHHSKNELYESPRPHKIAQGQTSDKKPSNPDMRLAEPSQKIWEKPRQETE